MLLLGLLQLLLGERDRPLRLVELVGILALLVFHEVFAREGEVLLREFHVGRRLVLRDLEVLALHLERGGGVRDGDFLVDLLVERRRDVELDEQVALLHHRPLGDDVEDGVPPLDLALEHELLGGLDLAVLREVDDERAALRAGVRLGAALLLF